MTARNPRLGLNLEDPVEYLAPPDDALSRFTDRPTSDTATSASASEKADRPIIAVILLQPGRTSEALEIVFKALVVGLGNQGADK